MKTSRSAATPPAQGVGCRRHTSSSRRLCRRRRCSVARTRAFVEESTPGSVTVTIIPISNRGR